MVTMKASELKDRYIDQAEKLIEQGLSITQIADMLRDLEAYAEQVTVPEAVGSCSTYIVGPGGAEILVTSRGTCLSSAWDNMASFVKLRIEEGYRPVVKHGVASYEGSTVSTSSAQGATVTSGNTTNAVGGNVMRLTSLYANVSNGKVYWKIEGKNATTGYNYKFPATVWPEVLEDAGIVVEELDPIKKTDMNGWLGEFATNEKGFPTKITKLWKE